MPARLQARLTRLAPFATPEATATTLVGLVLALKLIAVALYVPAGRHLFDLGFSFDAYVKGLASGKGFVGCEDFGCHHASRMPALPYITYALSFFTLSAKSAAFLKALALSALSLPAARAFARALPPASPAGFVVGAGLVALLVFSPNLVKHMSVLHYEEGYLIEIVASLVMLLLALLLRAPAGFSPALAAYAVALAGLSYLFKSSQVLMLAASTLVVVILALKAGRGGVAAMLLGLALLAPAGWSAHNLATGKRLSFMSSYDGENMFRGFNAHTLAIYPRCGLDVLFNNINLCEGRRLDLPKEPSRFGFADEWAWNDAYKARALAWISANPAEALKVLGVKFFTFVASPRLVPHVLEDEVNRVERWRGRGEEWLGGLWLALGRLVEGCGLVLALWLLARGDSRARGLAASALLVSACYAAPYVLGFGYERHFSIFILICALFTLVLAQEALRLRAQAGQSSSRHT